jgi:hypothetical protein
MMQYDVRCSRQYCYPEWKLLFTNISPKTGVGIMNGCMMFVHCVLFWFAKK